MYSEEREKKKNGFTKITVVLTSMGLTGVDGKGWRYSGCKMCPARAVSIFKTLMGRRLAWREGSAGETELWTDRWLSFTAPFSPVEPLSQAGFVLFLRTEIVGDVIMTQFSWKWLRNTWVKKAKNTQTEFSFLRRRSLRHRPKKQC